MDKKLATYLESNGFAFDRVPNLTVQPKKKYYCKDKSTGEIKELILPADPYSLRHYLRKGFKLNPNDLPRAEVKTEQPSDYQI